MKALIMLAASALLVGCGSSGYPVHFVTDPPNALVSCHGTPLGYAPVIGYFNEAKIAANANRLPLDCRATWVSGATSTFPREVNTVQYPSGVEAVSKRPESAPNYTQDAQAAMMANQQRQSQPAPSYNNGPTYTTCNRVFGQLLCNSF